MPTGCLIAAGPPHGLHTRLTDTQDIGGGDILAVGSMDTAKARLDIVGLPSIVPRQCHGLCLHMFFFFCNAIIAVSLLNCLLPCFYCHDMVELAIAMALPFPWPLTWSLFMLSPCCRHAIVVLLPCYGHVCATLLPDGCWLVIAMITAVTWQWCVGVPFVS